MTLSYKILLSILLLAAVFGGGYYSGKGMTETQVVEHEKIVYKEAETKTVYKDRIVERVVIRQPDGTVIEKEKTIDSDKAETKTDTTIANDTTHSEFSKPVLSNYSLGVKYWVNYSSLLTDVTRFNSKNVEVTAGRRLVGEVWVDAGVRQDAVSLGLSFKF